MIRVAVCFWLAGSAALAADVDPSLCRDIDAKTQALVPVELRGWYKFPHAVQACPTYDREHRFLWWIITINLKFERPEAHEDANLYPFDPGGYTRHCTPKPYIIDSGGRELGRVSDAFPTGGFGHTELFLSQWKDGFPRHMNVKVFDAGVEGDFIAPSLQWNPKTRHYDQIGEGVCDVPPLHKEE